MVGSQPGEWQRVVRWLSQRLIYSAAGERNDCPACSSRDIFELDVLLLRARRIGFVCACHECGLVFANPLPPPNALDDFYSPSGEWANRRDIAEEPPSPKSQLAGGTWVRMFDPIRPEIDVTAPPAGASVLDFGCGEGKLLDMFQHCGWQTWGIEPALDRAFVRHRRLQTIPETPTFDLVVTVQVLEHVANPLQVLRQLAAACRVGGHLLVGVPRFDTLPVHRDYRYVINGRAHITAYTWACLRTLLARSGWEPVAPPPFKISKGGGGRQTTSRLRVLARRVDGIVSEPAAPADEARLAVREYYASAGRPLFARAGLLRLAARRARWQRERASRKATRHIASTETSQS